MTGTARNVDVATALTLWMTSVRDAGGMLPLTPETIDLAAARGRITAESVAARRSSPPFDAAAMDGIAVAAETTHGAPLALAADAYDVVDTGDLMPLRADAVITRESLNWTAAGAEIATEAEPFANVRQIGEDVAAGDLLLQAGRTLLPADIAVLASAGSATVTVRRRPVVAILPTGDELVPVGAVPALGQVVETNSLMLGAMLEQEGAVAARSPIAPDDSEVLAGALERVAAEADLVLVLSGSSRGTDDHTVAVIERVGSVVVQGVAVKPGHPVVLGVVGSTPVMGVPGYPVSAALAFDLFVTPYLAALAGSTAPMRPTLRATARLAIPSTPRSDEWVRVRVARIGDERIVLPLRRGAGVLSSLAGADGLVRIPQGSTGIAEGDAVEVELLRSLSTIDTTLLVAGSTDPLIDHLASLFALRTDPGGSASGAAALAAGRCHLALVAAGDLREEALVIAAWERGLGLMVPAGNPLGLTGIDDLARPEVRIVNRPPGSSSRRLLDSLLAAQRIPSASVTGYGREARSHAAAAATVAAGLADCALGVASACSVHDLELVPLTRDTIVLAAATSIDGDRVAGYRAGLSSPASREAVARLGYHHVAAAAFRSRIG